MSIALSANKGSSQALSVGSTRVVKRPLFCSWDVDTRCIFSAVSLSASCKLAIIFSPRHVQNELELLASPCLHETTCSCMCTYVAPWNQESQTQKTWQDQVIHQIWAISFQNLYPECFGVTSTVWSLEIAFHGIRSPTRPQNSRIKLIIWTKNSPCLSNYKVMTSAKYSTPRSLTASLPLKNSAWIRRSGFLLGSFGNF